MIARTARVTRPDRLVSPGPGGDIRSSVRVFSRTMLCGGKAIVVGGIGDVSTNPKHEKKGLAKALMQRSVDFMRAHGVALGVLHTSSAVKYYASLGWTVWLPCLALLLCAPPHDGGAVSLHALRSWIENACCAGCSAVVRSHRSR